MIQDSVMQFLIEDVTPDQLLDALAYHAHRQANNEQRLELAARAYITNSIRYIHHARPPKGEGLRAFAEKFGVSFAELRRAVEEMSNSE